MGCNCGKNKSTSARTRRAATTRTAPPAVQKAPPQTRISPTERKTSVSKTNLRTNRANRRPAARSGPIQRMRKAMLVPDAEKEQRLEMCRKCEHFRAKTTRCGKCGCFLNVKARLTAVSCPIGKW